MENFKQLSDLQEKRDKAAKNYVAYAEAQEEVKNHGDVTLKAPPESKYLLTLKAGIILLLASPLILLFISALFYGLSTSFFVSSKTGIAFLLLFIGGVLFAYLLASIYASVFYGAKHFATFSIQFKGSEIEITQGVLQKSKDRFDVNSISSFEFDNDVFARLSGISSLSLYGETPVAKRHLATLDGFSQGSEATIALLAEIQKRTRKLK